jgi:hypothetical protein
MEVEHAPRKRPRQGKAIGRLRVPHAMVYLRSKKKNNEKQNQERVLLMGMENATTKWM